MEKHDHPGKFKKIVFRITAIIAGFLLIPIFVCWIVLTQPFAFMSRSSVKSNAAEGAHADPDRLKTHVLALTEKFHPRDCQHVENLDRVAAYIGDRFRESGARVGEQPYDARGKKTYRNVIGKFGPENGEPVIVGAHYDACGDTPGADDNASAVAGLMELAHLLRDVKLSAPVWLIAYSLEEPPYFATEFMGSAVHAASLKETGQNIRIMICLEMIGYFTDSKDSQSYPAPGLKLFYPSVGNFITVAGTLNQRPTVARVKNAMQNASTLKVCSFASPRVLPGIDFSDHRAYWDRGYTAVMITDTAFFRNPNYHTPQDTSDTLDYKRMAMVVRGVFFSVLDFVGN